MGRKRIAVVGLVITIVVGLVVLLVFQASPDERLLASYIPRVEQRLGVKLSFQNARASLTGVVIEGVEVRSAQTGHLLCRAARVGVGLRIGPLLLGDVQITGVRFDGLTLMVGEAAGGAPLAEWQAMYSRLSRAAMPATDLVASASRDIEVTLESAAAHVSQAGVALSVAEVGGRLTRSGVSALRTGAFEFSVANRRLISADSVVLERTSPTDPIGIELLGARAELPGERSEFEALWETFSRATKSSPPGASVPEVEAAPLDAADWPELTVAAKDARFELTRGEEGVAPAVRDIVVRSQASNNGWSLSANGRLDTPDEREVGIVLDAPTGRPVTATVEFNMLPLDTLGPLLVSHKALGWAEARVSGTVSASLDPAEVKASGDVSLVGLEVRSENLAQEPLRDFALAAAFEVRSSRTEPVWQIDSLVFERSRARLEARGQMRTDRLAFDLQLHVPRTNCRYLLTAVPTELKQRLGEVQLDGQFEMELHLAVDAQAPEQTVFNPALDNRCRIAEPGAVPPPDYFRGPFAYTAADEDGNLLRLVTGPGTDRWTELHRISAFMAEALLTTEDGKFFHHQGVTAPEVRRAIALNLKREQFAHGASTLTMQLAKNLFLGRERTVARKAQELFFVWYLESNFTKEELLELYLNIVEFGPSLYGITDAALHYFGREPAELSALESVFLVKLLPNPVSRHKAYDLGRVEERGMGMLRRVLRSMRERRRISEAEYQQALGETLVFHREAQPLPAPRLDSLRGISDLVGSPVVEEEQDAGEPDEE